MQKNTLFEKNKDRFVKKPTLYTTTIILIAICFAPLAHSCTPYTLTVNIDGSGIVQKNPDQATYDYNDMITLTAVANTGWVFDHWSGALSGNKNPKTITMTENKVVTATFTQNTSTLTVNIVGSGSVTKSPDQATYHYNDIVQLTANADLGWHFDHWCGDLTSGVNPANITIDGNKAVTAYFDQDQYTLTITIDGDGHINKNPDQPTYTYGTSVQLTAVSDPGWQFDHWTADLQGNQNPITITIDSDKTVIAYFTIIEDEGDVNENTLSIEIVGNGSITINPNQSTFTYGTLVTLTALADPGWTFNHWSGDLTGDNITELINMTSNRSAQAFFTQNEDPEEPEIPEEPEEPEVPEEPVQPTSTTRHSSTYHFADISPLANASGPYYGTIDEDIEFNGSKSYDADGIIIYYGWLFGDGESGLGEKVTHHYSHGGLYQVILTVIDNLGVSDTDVTNASIVVPNRPPANPFIAGPVNGTKNTEYSYVFGSTDADNDDITYSINWDDGSTFGTGFLANAQYFSMIHHWNLQGDYTITVTASDGKSIVTSELEVTIHETLIADNIALIFLGLLALIALIAILLYSKTNKKNK